MASIQKLSIRGVRSFSPDDVEQVLEFYFPCTVIVGANGCGKTTIIESLKFAIAGAMPPGNRSGQAFIHDPRSLGQSSVKAVVKCRFTGRAGNSMVVVRSMEVQQKKTSMTFKQLDGVLRSTDENGNRISMGHKCSELDRQLPLLLGVSKAVLEHVVFCHQEDSTWLLQEGAVLKKRFDDIFDSTRYTKALEVFSKLKKEYTASAKELKADVAGLSSHKHAAKGFRQEEAKYHEQLQDVEEEMEETKQALKEAQDEEERLDSIMEEITQVSDKISFVKQELHTKQQVLKTQSEMVSDDLTTQYTLSELKERLREFDSERTLKLEQQADLKAEVQSLQQQVAEAQHQRTQLQQEAGRLQAMQQSHQENLKKRFEKMVDLGTTYALGDALSAVTQTSQQRRGVGGGLSQTQNSSFSTLHASAMDLSMEEQQEPILDIPSQDMEEFTKAVQVKETELFDAKKALEERHRSSEDELQTAITQLSSKALSLRHQGTQLQAQQKAARDELRKITAELNSIPRMRKADLEEARQNAQRMAQERERIIQDPRLGEIRMERKEMEHQLESLKRDLEDDKAVLEQLRLVSQSQHALEVLKQQAQSSLEELGESHRDIAFLAQSYNLPSFPKTIPSLQDVIADTSSLTAIFEKFFDESRSKMEAEKLDWEQAKDQVRKLESIVAERKGALRTDMTSLQEKRAAMGTLKESVQVVQEVVAALQTYERDRGISTMVDETKPQELLAYLNQQLAEEQSKSLEGISPETIKKIIKRLSRMAEVHDRNQDFQCPCCTRPLSTQEDLEKMVKNLKYLRSAESPLLQEEQDNAVACYTKWRDIVNEKMYSVLEYRRMVNEVHQLETKSGDMEEKIEQSCRQLEDARTTASELETRVEELSSLLDAARKHLEEASRISSKCGQVKEKELEFSYSAGVQTGGRDLKAVEKAVNDRQEEREELNNKLSRLDAESQTILNRQQAITEQAERTSKLLRDKEKKMAEEVEKSKKKQELADVIENCAEELKRIHAETAPLEQRVKSKEEEKKRLRNMNDEERERHSQTLNNFGRLARELKELAMQIERYENSSTERDLASIDRKTETYSKKAEETSKQVDAILPELQRISREVEDQEALKKNLKQNIDIMEARKRIKVLEKESDELSETQRNIPGSSTVTEDAEALQKGLSETGKILARLEGRRGEIIESIRSIKRKLSADEYKNVDEEHRVATIKYETTQMTVKDLEKYHNSLDKALLRFHSLKISEINKIIRDLWSLTYKGQDITSIKIVSGQDAGSRASRSYNYRVVMTKGATEMDMRGRCSAGQRVLASIVIRLALAETFCVNFGCIALDEPTVNLDFANRKGLAVALAQIIAARSQQSNFQLILITHDEDFVSMMKTELASQSGVPMPEKYFQVRREEGVDGKFYSKIDAVDWDDLV